VEKEVLANMPTIVVIQGGVPDALRYKRDQFKAGLEDLIEILQKANVRVVVCSCTSLGEKHDGTNRIDKNLDEFAEVARQVAKDKKLPLNDLRKAFQEHWKKHNTDNKASGILTHDGNHFNDVGNQFVAAQMLKMFKQSAAPTTKNGALAPEQFDELVRLIRPDAQRGETKWLELAWMTDTLAARKKAAAEDKPIVVWTMSACPLGGD
jgi:ABC-type hemin transport system substrate-binding protein